MNSIYDTIVRTLESELLTRWIRKGTLLANYIGKGTPGQVIQAQDDGTGEWVDASEVTYEKSEIDARIESAFEEAAPLDHNHDPAYLRNSDVVDRLAVDNAVEDAALDTLLGAVLIARPRVKIGSFANPALTGTQSVTGVGFKPRVVLFCTMPADNTTDVAMHIGAMDVAGNQFAAATRGTTGAFTAKSSTSSCLWTLNTAGTTSRQAAYSSMDSDGFTVNWTTAVTGGNTYYVAIGDAADSMTGVGI